MDEQMLNQSNYSKEDYWQFFGKLIMAECSLSQNPQGTQETLLANIDKLNQTFLEYFPDFCERFINSNYEKRDIFVLLIGQISIRISDFSSDNIAINKEIAIAGYNIVLANQIENTIGWALIQNHLGEGYRKRIKGSRADNLESAIAYYNSALTVYTKDASPQDWARNQSHLALAYTDRIKGSIADNLESAITYSQNALNVYTKDAFPQDWATTQNNLGLAYLDRIKGSRADNLERVIACFENALTVYTKDAFSQDWAMTQNALGNAYFDRIKGSRADNLESAITCFENALTVYTKDAFPQDWAMTQNNLGNSYRERIKGSRADNLESAITCFENALTVFTKDALPEQWAGTQNNLAMAYDRIKWYRIKGDKRNAQKLAINCYKNALTVFTKDALPEQWAMTENNLGLAYLFGIESIYDNLEEAITCYENALTVYTKDAFPQDWAQIQNNLALAYKYKAKRESKENNILNKIIRCIYSKLGIKKVDKKVDKYFNESIKLLREALTTRKPTDLPQDCLQSAKNLGDLGFETERWDIAQEGYLLGIEAVEKMCEWSPPESHQQIRADALGVYEKMILVCLYSNDLATALETVERSKSRSVVQMFIDAELEPKTANQEQLQRFRALRRELWAMFPAMNNNFTDNSNQLDNSDQPDEQTRQANISSGDSKSNLNQERQRLQKELEELLVEINDPNFSLTQKIIPIHLAEIQNLLDDQTVILDWYILNGYAGWFTFIVTKHYIQVKVFTDGEHDLQQWQKEYLEDYRTEHYDKQNKLWSNQLPTRLEKLSEILGINAILEAIAPEYQQLILIPHQFLHTLPLHALPAQRPDKSDNIQTGYLLELFAEGVHYIPNCRLLERLHQKQKTCDQSLDGQFFAIQNPTNNLPYADTEVQTIQQQIQNKFQTNPTILAKAEATKNRLLSPEILAALKTAKYLHFACHTKFNEKKPLYSALQLAKESHQTTDNIIENSIDNSATSITDQLPPAKERLITLRDGEKFDAILQGLTMQDIVAKLDLPQTLLVILSACETNLNLIDRQTIDEYIGLPTAFFLAGALRVISSNWPVDDFVTAFLMVRAYYNYLSGEYTISQSLQQAQIWLKNVSSEKFIQWLRDDLQYSDTNWKRCRLRIKRMNNQSDRPFDHPKYWASFQHIGLV